ncbi:MAG: succinylglutamate desuccinylase/aspartoacylase family protein [Gammaproteobacteria bacterium]
MKVNNFWWLTGRCFYLACLISSSAAAQVSVTGHNRVDVTQQHPGEPGKVAPNEVTPDAISPTQARVKVLEELDVTPLNQQPVPQDAPMNAAAASSPPSEDHTHDSINSESPHPQLTSKDNDNDTTSSTSSVDLTSTDDGQWSSLELLGETIAPNQRLEVRWTTGQSFDGSEIKTPVTIIRGAMSGPTLCLTAAVHGDEVNGVEVVRRILSEINAKELAGSVIGSPIVNMLGFARGSRYLPDRRDLNRYFPGQPHGSFASRIAYVFFNDIVRHCDALVDFHTGSFKRTNLPQLRADLSIPSVKDFIENFGATAVLNKSAAPGTLRGAATSVGIPAVAFELGAPVTLQLENIDFGVKAIETLLDKLGMLKRFRLWSEPQPVFYRSRWLRAYRGGILNSSLTVGGTVEKDDLLGWVTNPITNERSEIRSPFDGRLLGRALNQFVLPGFAIFHIGIEAKEKEELVEDVAIDEAIDYASDDNSQQQILIEDFPDDNETH